MTGLVRPQEEVAQHHDNRAGSWHDMTEVASACRVKSLPAAEEDTTWSHLLNPSEDLDQHEAVGGRISSGRSLASVTGSKSSGDSDSSRRLGFSVSAGQNSTWTDLGGASASSVNAWRRQGFVRCIGGPCFCAHVLLKQERKRASRLDITKPRPRTVAERVAKHRAKMRAQKCLQGTTLPDQEEKGEVSLADAKQLATDHCRNRRKRQACLSRRKAFIERKLCELMLIEHCQVGFAVVSEAGHLHIGGHLDFDQISEALSKAPTRRVNGYADWSTQLQATAIRRNPSAYEKLQVVFRKTEELMQVCRIQMATVALAAQPGCSFPDVIIAGDLTAAQIHLHRKCSFMRKQSWSEQDMQTSTHPSSHVAFVSTKPKVGHIPEAGPELGDVKADSFVTRLNRLQLEAVMLVQSCVQTYSAVDSEHGVCQPSPRPTADSSLRERMSVGHILA